jgi:hypothetical protein
MVTITFDPIETNNEKQPESIEAVPSERPTGESLPRQLKIMANKIALQAVDFALHDRPQASIELGV